MARYGMFLALLVILTTHSLSALSAAPINGKVTAKRGDSLLVEFSSAPGAAPIIGDRVEFSTVLVGLTVAAGWGEVLEVETQSVWVKVLDGKPNLKMSALIQATGKLSTAERAASINTQPLIVSNNDSSGWGNASEPQPDSEAIYIESIVGANKNCDFLRAQQLAEQARSAFPNNVWLQQNRETFVILAQRSGSYQQAINDAYRALERGGVGDSITFMKVAMQNASVQCGQDKQVLSLLEQAKQIAKIQRDEVVERARINTVSSAADSRRHRAEIEQKRASDKAFGQALQGNLLGLLKSISGSAKPAFSGSTVIQETDLEMTRRMVKESEKNNSEILNKWRASQGWDTVPQSGSTPAAESTPGEGSDSGW